MRTIYQILCTKTNKVYIGQTTNYSRRVIIHKSHLRQRDHHNKKLQQEWDEYGEDSIVFKKLETGIKTKDEAFEKETCWYNVFKHNNTYEVINGVQPNRHCNSAEITGEMIIDAKNGITQSEWKGKYNLSEGVLKKLKKRLGIAGDPKEEVVITDEMVIDAKNQISQKDWAKKYGCSVYILKKIRKEHNVPKVPNSKPIEATEEMIEDVENGITQKQWVDKYPYSIGVLKRIKKDLKDNKNINGGA